MLLSRRVPALYTVTNLQLVQRTAALEVRCDRDVICLSQNRIQEDLVHLSHLSQTDVCMHVLPACVRGAQSTTHSLSGPQCSGPHNTHHRCSSRVVVLWKRNFPLPPQLLSWTQLLPAALHSGTGLSWAAGCGDNTPSISKDMETYMSPR